VRTGREIFGWGVIVLALGGCSDGNDHGEKHPVAGDDPWPWLDAYSSPGCARAGSRCTTFTDDRDGKSYRAVTIENQTWMGTALNFGSFTTELAEPAPGVVPKLCPLDDPKWCDRAGAEYRWSVAMALPTRCETEDCVAEIATPHRGICPAGWHVPTVSEFHMLLAAVGTPNGSGCDTGLALKTTQGWVNTNGDRSGTDSSGLSILPQVMTPSAGTVWVVRTHVWSAASHAEPFGVLDVSYGSDCATIARASSIVQTAFSVRCVAD
jgi:uncharacterized protein (TIGR02145 family)